MVQRTFVMLLLAWSVAARQQPSGTGVDAIGPKVGEEVLDFELRDQHGVSRRFSSLLGPKGAMLVFYRSADW